MRKYLRVTCLAVVVGSPLTAAAETYIEPVAGLAIPIADDDYTKVSDSSAKLGVRIGSMGHRGVGAEVALDFTPVNDGYDTPISQVDIQRFRVQLGTRFGKRVGKNAFVFGRLAAGVDVIRYNAQFPLNIEFGETDAGLAVEAAGGIAVDLGPVAIGAQLGLPMAFHFNPDDPDVATDADLEYTGVDIDVLFGLTVTL